MDDRRVDPQLLGVLFTDVVDAVGASVALRMAVIEQRVLHQAHAAARRTAALVMFMLWAAAAWICVAMAVHTFLKDALGPVGSFIALALGHAVLAALSLLLLGTRMREVEET